MFALSLLASRIVSAGIDLYLLALGINAVWRVTDGYRRSGGVALGLVGAGHLLHDADRLFQELNPVVGGLVAWSGVVLMVIGAVRIGRLVRRSVATQGPIGDVFRLSA